MQKISLSSFRISGLIKKADDGEATPPTQRWPLGASQVSEDVENNAGSEKRDPRPKTMAAQVGSAWAPVISRSSKPVVVLYRRRCVRLTRASAIPTKSDSGNQNR